MCQCAVVGDGTTWLSGRQKPPRLRPGPATVRWSNGFRLLVEEGAGTDHERKSSKDARYRMQVRGQTFQLLRPKLTTAMLTFMWASTAKWHCLRMFKLLNQVNEAYYANYVMHSTLRRNFKSSVWTSGQVPKS
jgi:hypothetical protein